MNRLKEILIEFPELEIVAQANDGKRAIELINSLKPELVFLDIQMPEATGFEVLKSIEHQPYIIFITAYDQYAIKAFEENALDYVMKPFSKERISKAVQRVLELNKPMDQQLIENLKIALQGREYQKRFAVKMGDEIYIISEQEIYYFQAENKYVLLFTNQKKFIIETSLKELEQVLDPHVFLRIHKGTIISLNKVKKIVKWFHSELLVQLSDSNKTKLKVSRNRKQLLKQKLHF
jgi:DNA-binding LytR/AlgR family response regulator